MKKLEKNELKAIIGGAYKVFEHANGVTLCEEGDASTKTTTCYWYGNDGLNCTTVSTWAGNPVKFDCYK